MSYGQDQMVMLGQAQQQAPQQQPMRRKASLAERANQAKLANQQKLMSQQPMGGDDPVQRGVYPQAASTMGYINQNYRQKIDPSALSNIEHQKNATVPYQGQNINFSKTNRNEKVEKRRALMAQFDDIPIHQLHKADGYQLRNIDDEEQSQGGTGFGEGEGEEDLKNVSLKDRVFNPKWKIRLAAFKAINQHFLDFDQNKERKKEDEMYGDPENPFDTYGPILEQMIKDTNLTAQYEGLNCLYTYVKLGKDIKSVTFACHSYLLDKIQHNKPNLKDITQRILQTMLKRGENIIPEILKRFRSKNSKAICFYLGILLQAINESSVSVQDINLKMVFKSTHELLGHQNKEIREDALHIMFYVYEHCEDDLNTFVSNLKNLRPV